MDKCREEFEKWEKSTYPEALFTFDKVTKEYIRKPIQADWVAWQAAWNAQEDYFGGIIAECRDASGFGTINDRMDGYSFGALASPEEVPAFIKHQFDRLIEIEKFYRKLIKEVENG